MKIIYSYLQKWLPDLKKSPREVGNDLTMIGHFNAGIDEIGKETVVDLEIRQNRGDCLGYYGIAKDLSVYYRIPLLEKRTKKHDYPNYVLPLEISSRLVKRVIAIKVNRLRNQKSPPWLRQFLRCHDINSVNALVDLTNFAMLWYGLPCHAFDAAKTSDKLIWTESRGGEPFTSLDSSKVSLLPGNLVVNSSAGISALAGVVGSQSSAIGISTQDAIIEMAVYDQTRIRQDARQLKIITEASTRLEKSLDPELIPQAFSCLINQVLDVCGGEIGSQLFDYYPNPEISPCIPFNPHRPSFYAGIKIGPGICRKIIKQLGCQIEIKNDQNWRVTPPTLRKDISLEEDLIEEVIRFYGYQKIPLNQPISARSLPDITPPVIYTIEKCKDILVRLGYDEIRSWPLVSAENLEKSFPKIQKEDLIITQNSINSDFPILRPAIIPSLWHQINQYRKFKIPDFRFFEIGKTYRRQKGQLTESYSLGLVNKSKDNLKNNLDQLKKEIPFTREPFFAEIAGFYAAELDLENINFAKYPLRVSKLLATSRSEAVQEITRQIIFQDANVLRQDNVNATTLLENFSRRIGSNHLWQIEIIDVYRDEKRKTSKYTFRVYYYNLEAKEAKKLHARIFGKGVN